MGDQSKIEQILNLVEKQGMLRTRDLQSYGIPRIYLSRMVQAGLLIRLERGLYMRPNAPLTKYHSFAEACKLVPHGVICLLSALVFHELTTQLPFEVWMAIENKAWAKKNLNLPLRILRFSGAAYTEGVEEYTIEGVKVKIYSAAKTVADCFKFRNKIGLDIAIEALRDGFQKRKYTVNELWHMAEICRVQNVMKPYVEAML